jgi:hypothetical protein
MLAVAFTFGLIGPVVALAYTSPATVNLGTAGNFVILSKTGISTTGATKVVGDIGVSPVAASYITGFDLILPAASAFSTSALVTGKVYASDYAVPTPANISTAVSNMQTAYTDAMGRAANVTELGAGNIGGLTLAPGVYKWGTSVTIPTDVTLTGNANDIWIFQIAQNLDISSAKNIVLAGGAKASNIFWVVAGQTTIGTTAVFNGNILDQTAIVLYTGAVLNGRALAQTAVTLDSNAVTMPTSVSGSVVTQTQTSTQTSSTNSTGSSQTSSGSTSSGSTATQTSSSGSASSNTNAALQTQLNGLLSTLHSLQVQASQQGSAPSSAFGQQVRAIAVNLGQGNRGNDVTILQQFLISQNKGPAAQSLTQVGATAYFGVLTRAALAEFQVAVGINPALGNFGPITRTYLEAH